MDTNLSTLFEAIREAAATAAQDQFNTLAAPYFISRMKVLGIARIEWVMGVHFYSLNKGGIYSGSELSELSPAKAAFVAGYESLFRDELYTLVNPDLNINK